MQQAKRRISVKIYTINLNYLENTTSNTNSTICASNSYRYFLDLIPLSSFEIFYFIFPYAIAPLFLLIVVKNINCASNTSFLAKIFVGFAGKFHFLSIFFEGSLAKIFHGCRPDNTLQ